MDKLIKKYIRFFTRRILPERLFIKLKFRKHFGYFPNLKNPRTFSEKIQWLKLNNRTPLHTICADKYLVRGYIKDIIGENYLVPLIFITFNPKDIIPENIPDYPCVIKTNHDNGGITFVFDKYKINWTDVQNSLKKKLKRNFYYIEKEWQYKNIKPRIIVEKLLLNKNKNIPFDFKVHCFNGFAKFIQVDANRGKSNHIRYWYDNKWKKMNLYLDENNVELDKEKARTFKGNTSNMTLKKPLSFDKMINYSEKISKKFAFVRIDWYDVEGNLFFGEITFHPSGGFDKMVSNKWEQEYGKLIEI